MSILSLGKQSIIYGFGHVLTRLATFLLLPLLTNALNPDDYGIISIIYIFIGFSMTFYRYGMDTALMKFYIESNNPKSYFSSILFIQVVTSLILSGLLFLAKNIIQPILIGNGQTILITYIAIIIFCDIIWNLIIITLRATEKAFQFVSFNLFNVILLVGLTIYFVNTKQMGVEGVLLGNVYASFILLLSSGFLLINRFSISTINFNIINKIIKFGLPFLPAAIFGIIMEGSDRFILRYMMDETAVGIYSAGYKLGIFGLLIVMGFSMGWTPYFLKYNKNQESNANYSAITTLFLGIYGFLGIIITLVLPQIKYISIYGYTLIGADYFDGISIAPIILMSYYFFGLYVLMLPRIYKYESTAKIPYFKLAGACSNIMLNIILIPKFGIVGSAFSTLISFAIMSYYIFYNGNRLEYIQYNLIGWIFPLFAWILVLIFIMVNNDYVAAFTIGLLYPIAWYNVIITEQEREKILEIVS